MKNYLATLVFLFTFLAQVDAQFNLLQNYTGTVNWSIDGVGGVGIPIGNLQVDVPTGSTILVAYLYSTTSGIGTTIPSIDFNGVTLSGPDWVHIGTAGDFDYEKAFRTDITSQVSSIVGSGSNSIINIPINSENPNDNIDGEALVIIYSNPSNAFASISLYDGGLALLDDP